MRSNASAIRKVLYDIKKNNAVSSNGKSLMWVNFVNNAVQQPMLPPIANEDANVQTKTPNDWKNGIIWNPPLPVEP